jgi:hypothetical protein
MGNPLNTARTSFFHKSVGGYSAVKVKRVQEVIDFYFQNEYNTLNQALENNDFDLLKQNHFFNMINTKYYIFNIDGNGIIDFKTQNNKKPGVLKNPYALGNAWTVSDVKWVSNPDEEILFLNNSLFDPSKIAVIDNKYKHLIGDVLNSGKSKVELVKYKANQLDYKIDSKNDELIVFSEIFYDKGWKAYVDGVETPHVRLNYILRGLKVKSGKHEIIFKYDLPIYNAASLISFSSSLIVLILFLILVFFKLKKIQFPEI